MEWATQVVEILVGLFQRLLGQGTCRHGEWMLMSPLWCRNSSSFRTLTLHNDWWVSFLLARILCLHFFLHIILRLVLFTYRLALVPEALFLRRWWLVSLVHLLTSCWICSFTVEQAGSAVERSAGCCFMTAVCFYNPLVLKVLVWDCLARCMAVLMIRARSWFSHELVSGIQGWKLDSRLRFYHYWSLNIWIQLVLRKCLYFALTLVIHFIRRAYQVILSYLSTASAMLLAKPSILLVRSWSSSHIKCPGMVSVPWMGSCLIPFSHRGSSPDLGNKRRQRVR